MRHSGRAHPLPKTVYTITVDVVHALVVERDGLKSQISDRDREIQLLRTRLNERERVTKEEAASRPLGVRSETTYLHIIGGLLRLLLGNSPSGEAYSRFRTEDAVMSTLLAQHSRRLGISERTLQAKFAAAKRALENT
jgi:hypothetical protein